MRFSGRSGAGMMANLGILPADALRIVLLYTRLMNWSLARCRVDKDATGNRAERVWLNRLAEEFYSAMQSWWLENERDQVSTAPGHVSGWVDDDGDDDLSVLDEVPRPGPLTYRLVRFGPYPYSISDGGLGS